MGFLNRIFMASILITPCYVFSLANTLFSHIPKHSIHKYSQIYPKLPRKETIFLSEIGAKYDSEMSNFSKPNCCSNWFG